MEKQKILFFTGHPDPGEEDCLCSNCNLPIGEGENMRRFVVPHGIHKDKEVRFHENCYPAYRHIFERPHKDDPVTLCKCGMYITFLPTKKGGKMPVDWFSLSTDEMQSLRSGIPVYYVRINPGDMMAETKMMTHFATCPLRDKFRKTKKVANG